jgi:hypothetical protein
MPLLIENSENIIGKSLEKSGLPENAVAVIMGFHGGVLGMVPREVWDWECQPLSRDPKSIPYEVGDVSGEGFCFDEISGFIRKGNWSLFREYLEFGSIRCDGYGLKIEVNEKNIRAVISGGAKVDFNHAKIEGKAKIAGYRGGVVELAETEYRSKVPKVPKTAKHRFALSSFKSLEVIATYKIVRYEYVRGSDSDSD